jgi:membrane-bound serine protease (ClpP class)
MNDPLFWSIGLLLLGLTLIIVEVFVPSGGVLSVLSVVAVLASIAVAFTGRDGLQRGAVMVIVTAILLPIVVALAVHWWPHSPLGRLILIKQPRPGGTAGDEDESHALKALVGKTGRARSKMLPSGVVSIEGRSYDAVSEGMPIEPGERVRVVSIRTRRIVVRPDDGAAPPIPAATKEPADDVLSRPAESLGIESLDDPLA